jgi:hypothetical protein
MFCQDQDYKRPATNMLCLVFLKLCFIQLIGSISVKKSWVEKPRATKDFQGASNLWSNEEEFLSY